MTTLSHPRPQPHRTRNALAAVVLAIVAITAIAFALLDLAPSSSTTDAPAPGTAEVTGQSQRGMTADELRLRQLAEYYESRGVGITAPADRPAAGDAGSVPLTRGQQADADRYQGLSEHHLGR